MISTIGGCKMNSESCYPAMFLAKPSKKGTPEGKKELPDLVVKHQRFSFLSLFVLPVLGCCFLVFFYLRFTLIANPEATAGVESLGR